MIHFDKENHKYIRNGKELISVTTLLSKHGLAPSYEGVSESVLEKARDFGNVVHDEIDKFIKTGDLGFTQEVLNLKKLFEKENIEIWDSEQIVGNDIVAGTYDMVGVLDKHGRLESPFVGDVKTTSKLYIEPVRWQLSLYSYLYIKATYNERKIAVFHADKNTHIIKMTVLEKMPIKNIEKLLQCERDGLLYKEESLSDDNPLIKNQDRFIALQEEISQLNAEIKRLEVIQENYKDEIMKQFKQNNIKSWESADKKLLVTYTPETTTTRFDAKLLEKHDKETYNKYLKTSKRKESLRITIRKDKDD